MESRRIGYKIICPGQRGWDEVGDWDSHIYTIDTMYKIDN